MKRFLVLLLVAVPAATGVARAAGPTGGTSDAPPSNKEVCREAYEGSQAHRKKNELLAARQMLRACAASVCPDFVRSDCIEWLTDVERSIPSVVVGAKTDAGEVYDVTLSVDGKTLMTELDGRAIELDPGRHTFEFTRTGSPPITRTEIVREGEKNRPISVSWATPRPLISPAAPEKPAIPMHRPVPATAYILTAVGVLGFGSFAYFGIQGNQQKNTLTGLGCSPFCDSSSVDSARKMFLAADISAGVGAAALAGALVVWLVRPEKPIDMQGPAIAPVAGGALVGWADAF
jgi:hypothetical protein